MGVGRVREKSRIGCKIEGRKAWWNQCSPLKKKILVHVAGLDCSKWKMQFYVFLLVLPVRCAVGCPGCTEREECAAITVQVLVLAHEPSEGGEQAGQVTLALAGTKPVCLHTWLGKWLQPQGARLKPVCKWLTVQGRTWAWLWGVTCSPLHVMHQRGRGELQQIPPLPAFPSECWCVWLSLCCVMQLAGVGCAVWRAEHIPALGRVLQVKSGQAGNRSTVNVISIICFPGISTNPLGPDSFIVQDVVQTHPLFLSLQCKLQILETSNSRHQ